MNQELFAKIAEVISAKPREFDMHSWEDNAPSCGTTRCVAGWAVHLTTGQPLYIGAPGNTVDIHPSVKELARRLDAAEDFEDLGARLLDIAEGDAATLFYTDNERARQVVDLFAHGYEAEAIDLLWSEE